MLCSTNSRPKDHLNWRVTKWCCSKATQRGRKVHNMRIVRIDNSRDIIAIYVIKLCQCHEVWTLFQRFYTFLGAWYNLKNSGFVLYSSDRVIISNYPSIFPSLPISYCHRLFIARNIFNMRVLTWKIRLACWIQIPTLADNWTFSLIALVVHEDIYSLFVQLPILSSLTLVGIQSSRSCSRNNTHIMVSH